MSTITYTIDAGELAAFAGDLRRVADRAVEELPPVVERGANNIKRDARRLVKAATSGTYLPHYPRAITYEMEQGGDWVQAKVGPEEGMLQGGMGRGVEFGSVHTAPIPHLFPAFEAEEPRFIQQVGLAAMRSLG